MEINFGNILKNLRVETGISQEQLGNVLGITRQAVSNYEQGKRDPDFETLEKIADYFNVDMDYLHGRTEIKNRYQEDLRKSMNFKNIIPLKKSTKKVPLLGTIAAGTPTLAEENIEEFIDIDKKVNADFCLRVKGTSMINANIQDGDIVFIHKQPDVDDGEIAAVLIDDEATLKRVYKIGDVVQLRAENPGIKPINLNGDKNVLILGKATYKLSKIL